MDSSSASGSEVVLTYVETKDKFGELFSAPTFIVFEVLAIGLCIICLVLSRIEYFYRSRFLMVGYVAGFLGGQQNMFLKGVGTFIGTAIAGDGSVFGDWLVYVFTLGMVSLASTQLFVLNQGLVQFPALLFVPTYTILYIVSGTLVGLIFYQEYKLMSTLGWIMFTIGFILIGLAMVILSMKDAPTEPGSDLSSNSVTPINVIGTGEFASPVPPFTHPAVGIGGSQSFGNLDNTQLPPTPDGNPSSFKKPMVGIGGSDSFSNMANLQTMPQTPSSVATLNINFDSSASDNLESSVRSRSNSVRSNRSFRDLANFPSFSGGIESVTSNACLGMSGGSLMMMTDARHSFQHHLPTPKGSSKRPAAKPANLWVEDHDTNQ